MTVPIVSVAGLTKAFAQTPVLNGINFEIKPGEIIGLVGENGAGKSTLMNIVAGSVQRSSGTIAYDGQPLELESIRHGQALGIRFVHQELSTASALSVAENIFLGRYLAGRRGFVNYRRLNREARRVLESVGLGHIDPGARLGSLRSGEQQLVELAKAISVEPRLLILDEPTSSLTPAEAGRLLSLVHELAARGTGVIFITHRLEEALAHCDRIVVLRDGRLIVDLPAAEARNEDLIVHMIGKPAMFAYHAHGANSEDLRIEVRDLAVDSRHHGASFSARRGEIVGLFGLVGAGRTEFLETLYGCRAAHGGEVLVDGEQMQLGSVAAAVRSGLFMLPEGRKARGILPTHSVGRNISISALREFSRLGFVDQSREDSESSALAGSLNIRVAEMQQPITSLSGGNQQKALFARAMLARAKVLLLDEPTHGVDVGAKAEIYEVISGLAADGVTVIVASSELPEILAIVDRCMVFAGGRIVADMPRGELSESAILSAAFTQDREPASGVQSRVHLNG